MDIHERACRIRLMAFDVDGVMTDGGITYTDQGHELKTFQVQDGQGIKLLQRAGIDAAIITGRRSGVVAARAADLGISHVFQGVDDKFAALDALCQSLSISWQEIAFMGDDLIDLPALIHCGLALAPANAHPEVKSRCHAVTDRRGGDGAVREAIEFVLEAQGHLAELLSTYLEPR